jgi:hypothetical protein
MTLFSYVLNGDPFWQNIINYLSQLDLYNLSQTCKYYNENINFKNNVIKGINTRLLDVFGDNYNTFKNILKKTKGVISGSFIIQSILNTYWQGSDIDIFIPIKENDMIKTGQTLCMHSEMDEFLNSIMVCVNSLCGAYNGDKIESNMHYIRTYETVITKYPIRILLIDTDVNGIHKFIKNYFDFDICKNAYWNYDNTDNIYTTSISDILNKQAKFAFGQNVIQSYDRCKKYVKRGFSFTDKYISNIHMYLPDNIIKKSIYELKLCGYSDGHRKCKIISEYYPNTVVNPSELSRYANFNREKNRFYKYLSTEHTHSYNCEDGPDILPIIKTCNDNCKKYLSTKSYYVFPPIEDFQIILCY